MKLFEEFKEVEGLWEAASNPMLKTFGKKTYDISKKDELEAWVNANVDFQMKRHPDRYSPDNDGGMSNIYPLGKFNTYTVRSNVLNNLLDNIAKDESTKEIRDHIWELITANAEDTSKKMAAFNRAKEAEAKSAAPVEEAKAAARISKAELKEMIKEALREELAAK